MTHVSDWEGMTSNRIISLPLQFVAMLGVLVAIASIALLGVALANPHSEPHHQAPPPAATLSPR
jgi:hypothetical protein